MLVLSLQSVVALGYLSFLYIRYEKGSATAGRDVVSTEFCSQIVGKHGREEVQVGYWSSSIPSLRSTYSTHRRPCVTIVG